MATRHPGTPEALVSSLLRIHPRFMRSVHLERDFQDPTSSLGYILTPVAQEALERITASFRAKSTQRAWRLTGDYGSGKTDFGLALGRVARGAREELPRALRRFVGQTTLLPVAATGDTEPLGLTILRALGQKEPRGGRMRSPTEEVVACVRDAVARARRKQHSGILLIVDELGKNLEYAARHPESDEIFLLQRLAEEAARSGDQPFVLVAMVHQGVSAYVAGMNSASRREWDKVAGRFEEIVYAQPIEQVAVLVAATLNVDAARLPPSCRRECEAAMAAALRRGLYGPVAATSMADLGPRIFPLHPTVLPVLVQTMRRFGQNERSLFSFISSAEPMGLQQHASRRLSETGLYRIHHLFDYVRRNLLPTVISGNAGSRWGVIEAVLGSAAIASPEEEAVLKTVAMFSLLDAPDLPATQEAILLSAGDDRKRAARAIRALRERGVIYERGTINGLCLWPHTSLGLDDLFTRAVEATASRGSGVTLLCERVRSEHLVPRAYYVKTGTLRYAEVKLIPASALPDFIASQPQLDGNGADLNVRVVLPADRVQERTARHLLEEASSSLAEGVIIALAEPPGRAMGALTDLIAWEWVKKNTPHLSGDRYAREEVTRQFSQAERRLRVSLGGLDNLAVPSGLKLSVYCRTGRRSLPPGRELLGFLGEECARIYSKAPRILNELINRRAPSSAAVAARTKLVEAMATAPSKASLGMDNTRRPAEMALYLSVVKAGGFHVEVDGSWVFRVPEKKRDRWNLLPSLSLITQTLQGYGADALVPVPKVFEALALPPFGIREGLRPFVLAIYLATHHQHLAIYEDGTFLHAVGGAEFLRLMKEPQFFHLQYCTLEGIRAEVFSKLLELLQISPRDADRADVIDLVRPLAVFISREVPEYCRKTNNLTLMAVAVRRALLDAREPVRLVFTTLPEACGLAPIGPHGLKAPEELAMRLRAALHEIRTAYPRLIQRLGDALCAAFDVTGDVPLGRGIIARRAAQLGAAVTEPSLKAFALRLADPGLDDRGWTESVANLIARKSPERWTDNDEAECLHGLEVMAGRFKRTELALIGTTRRLNGHACRIALTKSDGTEVSDFVNWEGLDESRIRSVEDEIHKILAQYGRYGLAAAMRAVWSRLEPSEKTPPPKLRE